MTLGKHSPSEQVRMAPRWTLQYATHAVVCQAFSPRISAGERSGGTTRTFNPAVSLPSKFSCRKLSVWLSFNVQRQQSHCFECNLKQNLLQRRPPVLNDRLLSGTTTMDVDPTTSGYVIPTSLSLS